MGKKIIKLTEKELYSIVETIIKEQKPDNLMPGQPDNPMNPDGYFTKQKVAQHNKIKNLQDKYKCLPKQFIYPFTLLLKKNYNKMWLKIALGIIGRESSYASGARYNVTNTLKQIASYVGYNSSLGPAQMKGSTAEDLGLKESDLFTDIGALDAAYRLIKKNFNLARQKGYTNKPSNLKGGTGNATLDIAIAAYNMGASKVMGPWCESVDPERIKKGLKTKCTKIPKSKQKIVVDYIPNFKTERWDGVNISSHGYIREVADHVKKMTCI
jgi:hypothetical protein